MARARTSKTAPPPDEPDVLEREETEIEEIDEFDEESEEEEEIEDAPAVGRKMSKAKAARAALEEGIESPQEACAFILERFGITMLPQHFSAVKSQLRKKEREAGGEPIAPGRRGRRPLLDNYLAPPRRTGSGLDADLLEAMEAIKPLVASLGADKVKRIVELLG